MDSRNQFRLLFTAALLAGPLSLFAQSTIAPPALPIASPIGFAHHHASTELEGMGIGGGQFLQGLGLGSMYHAQGELLRELAAEQRLKNREQYLHQQRGLQGEYQAQVAYRQAKTRAYNLAKQSTRPAVNRTADLTWPTDLGHPQLHPHRAALTAAVRQVESGDAAGATAVRVQSRRFVECVSKLVRAGELDPRGLTAAVRLESALNDYAAAVQAAALSVPPAVREQQLAER